MLNWKQIEKIESEKKELCIKMKKSKIMGELMPLMKRSDVLNNRLNNLYKPAKIYSYLIWELNNKKAKDLYQEELSGNKTMAHRKKMFKKFQDEAYRLVCESNELKVRKCN